MYLSDPNLVLLGIALLNVVTALVTWRTHLVVLPAISKITQLEKNTNSIKDALVKVTGEAAHAAGKEEGRVEGEQKAAILAEGKLNP